MIGFTFFFSRLYREKTEEFNRVNMEPANNNWNLIDDFNWLSLEPSPNWSILPEDERVQWKE